jgi:hypothetical protein
MFVVGRVLSFYIYVHVKLCIMQPNSLFSQHFYALLTKFALAVWIYLTDLCISPDHVHLRSKHTVCN